MTLVMINFINLINKKMQLVNKSNFNYECTYSISVLLLLLLKILSPFIPLVFFAFMNLAAFNMELLAKIFQGLRSGDPHVLFKVTVILMDSFFIMLFLPDRINNVFMTIIFSPISLPYRLFYKILEKFGTKIIK
jgi:hypothetical protein